MSSNLEGEGEGRGGTYDPPITLLSPLNTLVRLLTTISAKGKTSTLTNPAIVSSITIKKLNSFANFLNSLKGGVRNNGFEGNSQKSARRGGDEVSSKVLREGKSEVNPAPKK